MSKRARGAEVSNQADVARRGLVSVNRLDYTLQPDLSVAVARSSKKHFFQGTEYNPLTRAICVLNSGAEYVDPQNSYLRFEVEVTTNALNLGAGSGINFIKQIILTSRSGDEIERIEQVNQLAVQLDRYNHSTSWINSVGQMIGYENATDTNGTGGVATTSSLNGVFPSANTTTSSPQLGTCIPTGAANKRVFVIPLGCITGLFRSFDRLLPPMLCSGMRIEIEWESKYDCGTFLTAIGNYTIHNPEIVLDQYQLTDSIMRVLNEESAMRGLEVVFSTWYNHESLENKNNQFHVQVRKAVSRALGLLVRIGPLRGLTSRADRRYLSGKADITSYQVRVGSLYFPQQAIQNTTAAINNVELYHHTMRGLGKFRTPHATTATPLKDFIGSDNYACQSIYTDFERSNTQKLTGMPINNSRVAEVTVTTEANATQRRCNTYLHYVRLLRVFLQNVEVEE